jgi:dTDP-4-dehydrorhamnose reductase
MKVIVIGANGQLGTDVCAALEESGCEVVPATHDDIEIVDARSVAELMAQTQPDAIVNTAAMHNVEQCEKEPSRAFAVNGLGTRNLATECDKHGTYLLQISTDYVFDGRKKAPYTEEDAPFPLNVYANSKLAGEYFALTSCKNGAVLRVSGVYGKNPCRAKGGLNFVQLMLKLARERPELRVVDDEVLTPTYAADIARQVVALVERRLPGLFHGTAQGSCSWYEFAKHIFATTGTKANLQKARPGEFPAKVPRPSYSVLENSRLQAFGIDIMPPWQNGLERYLYELS